MTRRSRRSGDPFQPDLLQGKPIDAVNAAFLVDAERWRLQFRCEDCANRRADGSCLYAWPNAVMRAEPFAAVSDDGAALFCRAFEPDGS
jgi:hypothetical protein